MPPRHVLWSLPYKLVRYARIMLISDADLEEFKKRYKAAFGVELTQAEASEAANNLAELYLFLSQPLPSEQRKAPTPRQGDHDSPSPS